MKHKPVVLTLHALAKMGERGISRDWIEAVVRGPLWIEPEPRDATLQRRFGHVDAFGGRFLRVVCVETDDAIRVIIAILDRGARKPI